MIDCLKGPHFLCSISGVVPINTRLILSWEENKCCYKLSKCIKWHILHSKRSKLSFGVKTVVILSVAQLVTTVIFFSAWDKSRVKWDNSWNSSQKMRTFVAFHRCESHNRNPTEQKCCLAQILFGDATIIRTSNGKRLQLWSFRLEDLLKQYL